jgi:hypothetical protein
MPLDVRGLTHATMISLYTSSFLVECSFLLSDVLLKHFIGRFLVHNFVHVW